jgi:hypothetical protein
LGKLLSRRSFLLLVLYGIEVDRKERYLHYRRL